VTESKRRVPEPKAPPKARPSTSSSSRRPPAYEVSDDSSEEFPRFRIPDEQNLAT